MTTLRAIVDEIFELHSIETRERNLNNSYIKYLEEHFSVESSQLTFINWLDAGLETLKNRDDVLSYINKHFVRISVSDFVAKIISLDLIHDLDAWMLNFQNYRKYFNDHTIDDIVLRVEHLYLRLSSIELKYRKLQNNLG
jgi:hypothetical protein